MDNSGDGEMAKVIELYTCCICGITNETCKQWGPICKKTGKRVCDACCYKCEHRRSWSGIWRCGYITPEDKRRAVLQRILDREETEIRKAAEVQTKQRQAYARAKTKRSARGRRR